ncbi:MAG TPA: PQQ-dependent dehydrogenase, methanol/ethanol family [Bryobacteraceae bacterium]|nr:PQQ-dependent dehydrogenase, methanol/ethanol family [Bryobacteraceae bacterium]
MMRRTKTGALLVLVAAFAAFAQQKGHVVDDNALKNAAKSGDEWLTYGRDYAETHFSPLKQINASNVKRLGLAWSWESESPAGARVEATPIVSNGVIYASLGWNVVVAVDARTGKLKWRWDPEIPRKHISEICCGAVNRGVALYKGKVYEGLLDGRLVALDQQTGKLLWSVKTTTNDDTILTAAVRVVKGKVIVGTSGAEQAVRGYFSAYDAETGKLVWRFYTVPGDPSKPFEQPELAMAAKTWTGEWWKMGGGGTVWDAMAYDPDADLLYIGTGNGGPWDRNLRSPGGGDNLFLASILAVKPDTGKLAWYFQETPGDDWDYTSTQPIVLADLMINGRNRKVLLHAPKNGFFYVLDRITGEFISGAPYAKRVTWATGLDKNGRPIEAKGARYGINPVLISPGNGGAHNWEAMAYSPLTRLVYIPGTEGGARYARDPKFVFRRGTQNAGMSTMQRPRDENGKVIPPDPPNVPVTEPEGADKQPEAKGGFLVAWDPVANKERWRVPSVGGYLRGGSTLATAGNLVFHNSTAYNAETGERLWEVDLHGENVAPVTYMLDGKQYISVFARSYPNNRLFTFVLDGKEPIPPLEPPASAK